MERLSTYVFLVLRLMAQRHSLTSTEGTNPLIWIDRKADEFCHAPLPPLFKLYKISDRLSKLEAHVQTFLTLAEKLPYDPSKTPVLDDYPINSSDRKRFCERLFEEVELVRGLPNEQKQWDMDICGVVP
jgi:hypothetical protein